MNERVKGNGRKKNPKCWFCVTPESRTDGGMRQVWYQKAGAAGGLTSGPTYDQSLRLTFNLGSFPLLSTASCSAASFLYR